MTINNTNILKIATFSLAIVSLLSAIYLYKAENTFKKYKEKVEVENQLRQNNLEVILHKYDSVNLIPKENNFNTISHLSLIVQETPTDSFENFDLQSINKQIKLLQSSIEKEKNQIAVLSKKIVLEEGTLGKLQSLTLPEVAKKGSRLSVLNITARGVKILSEKLPNSKDKKIQELRICFTVEGNELVKKGDKQFYIQVVNPKNKIMSLESSFIELKDIKLVYSAKIDASYDQKDMDVCTYVNLEKEKTIKGKYKINIYNEFTKIGTTIFEYN